MPADKPKQTPAHILHVVIALEPGGLENGIVNTAARLDPTCFRVSVCCLERAGAFAGRLPTTSQVVALEKQPGFFLKTAADLKKLLRNIQPDLIHTHGLGPLIYTTLALGLARNPPILHGEHRQLLPQEQKISKILLRRLLYRRCRRIHTVGKSLQLHFQNAGLTKQPILAIPNGVDLERFKPADKNIARLKLKLPTSSVIIGMVANFRPEKGHLRLIQAFNKIEPERANLRLLLVGDGPELNKVNAEAETSLAPDRVIFAGHQDDPAPWYQAMDLLILPSAAEGLSNAALEAMASGIPVLASEACGNSDVIRHHETGFLCNLTTPESIATALQMALSEPERLPEMGMAARKLALASFSIELMAEQYARCYSEMLNF